MSEDVLKKWATLIAATAGWVSEHDEADAKSDCIQELAAALRAERARVAELEADAKLGRMVDEMPIGAGLAHCDWTWAGLGKGEWVADWPIGEDRGATVYNRQYGDSARAAMEAAQKGETPRAAKHTICLPQFEEGESWVSHTVPVSKLEIDEGEPKEDKP